MGFDKMGLFLYCLGLPYWINGYLVLDSGFDGRYSVAPSLSGSRYSGAEIYFGEDYSI